MKKTWTYQEITESAIRLIRSSMQLSEKASANGDTDLAGTFRQFAFGNWCCWNTLTSGWQEPGDCERLESMTKATHA